VSRQLRVSKNPDNGLFTGINKLEGFEYPEKMQNKSHFILKKFVRIPISYLYTHK